MPKMKYSHKLYKKKKLFFPNVESRNWNILFVRENSSSKAKKKVKYTNKMSKKHSAV